MNNYKYYTSYNSDCTTDAKIKFNQTAQYSKNNSISLSVSNDIQYEIYNVFRAMQVENSKICPISGETEEEEQFNYWTHLIGFVLSLIGASALFWSSLQGDGWTIVSCYAYGITLIGLYAASTFYHRCTSIGHKKRWKIVDHSFIYLFIAGSYTPFTLGPLRDTHGLPLFFVIWAIALGGIVVKVFAIHSFKRFSLFSYLLMGWLIVFSFPALMDTIPFNSLVWLLLGGLSYTFGTLFYAWEALPYNHAVWHLFVLGGSVCHYWAIFNLV